MTSTHKRRGISKDCKCSQGKKYLDLYGGHAVALTGHCHPVVVKAVKEQLEKLIFYSNVVYSSVRAQASEAIINVAPKCMHKVFFCNSGAEANETAMKICRKYTGKKKIIAMKDGFHGRTTGALSATGLGNYRKQFTPVLEDYLFVEFGNIKSLENALQDDVGGIILEQLGLKIVASCTTYGWGSPFNIPLCMNFFRSHHHA